MKASTFMLFSLLLCGVSNVQAAPRRETLARRTTLAKRVRQNEIEISRLRLTMLENFEELELTLKEELTRTFVPPLIKNLVQQAMADILEEDFIGNILSGHVLDEVQSLKANVQNTKTQVKALAQQLKQVQRERDIYRDSLRKLRGRLTKDIRALQLQLNQTAADLRDARTSAHPRTTAASTDPSHTVPPVTVSTQGSDRHDSTTDTSEDPTLSSTVPPAPETTRDPDALATPSPATGRDLYDASKDGDLGRVKRILSAGHVDINYRGGRYSRTPVMAAAVNGHRDVVEFLVGRGADVSLVDRGGNNVLHYACDGGDVEMVKLILDLDVVDVNYRGHYSRTPVMAAAVNGHWDVVEFLVGRGADVSLVDRGGNNVLHYACYNGDVETVKLILDLDVVDVNYRGHYSRTPVMAAALNGHRDVVEFLVGRGADVSLVDGGGDNILHYACYNGDVEMVKLILDLDVVDVNYRGHYSRTPVMAAAVNGHWDVVEFLVGRGADVSLVDRVGDNILHYACDGGDVETVKLILDLDVVDVNYRGHYSRTPVMAAAVNGHWDVVEFLVGRGADVSLVDRVGDNILHYACDGGDVEMVKLILDLDVVDVNARNNNGYTAADIARRRRHQRVLDLLVSRGAH
ncbi:ankyrin repeat domain-containing protein 50-like [Haliotis asinina]|uniref:ankyrin repeat domain-containing protein 50-like n=1 Tax=Haliotis asinina TaxID=109174 RepID=UPI0035323852